MNKPSITNLAALKESGYRTRSIKDELRENLILKMKADEPAFEGVWGYEHSVIPELEQALLSRHHINLLGLRGQAKTRLARLMVNLLDEWMPIVAGSEINDDPLNPISKYARDLLAEKKGATPIDWVHRSERFFEKLATPDVTIADLIGDVDPIKAANLKLSYSDEGVLHYGMIPRANRCIFVINELPDLQSRIQVALFNILEEGDVQIRGFKVRLPLDIQFVFTANPEDYTNRGSIVTPLKDRIGSQILTHYPQDLQTARKITAQESYSRDLEDGSLYIPELARDLLELISFQARKSEYVDVKSGVSARLSISAFENLCSAAERRMIKSGDKTTAVRLSDFMGIVPSITGKIELVYEGEQEGAASVAEHLIEEAAKDLFKTLFPEIKKLERKDEAGPYDDVVNWFFEEAGLELSDNDGDNHFNSQLNKVRPLDGLIDTYQPEIDEKDRPFLKELILWGLVAYNKLSKQRFQQRLAFKDPYSNYISRL